jgi:hypothetical protein
MNMDIVTQYPQAFAIATGAIIIVENVLPHLPIKANSTAQIVINIIKAILGKKAK